MLYLYAIQRVQLKPEVKEDVKFLHRTRAVGWGGFGCGLGLRCQDVSEISKADSHVKACWPQT